MAGDYIQLGSVQIKESRPLTGHYTERERGSENRGCGGRSLWNPTHSSKPPPLSVGGSNTMPISKKLKIQMYPEALGCCYRSNREKEEVGFNFPFNYIHNI